MKSLRINSFRTNIVLDKVPIPSIDANSSNNILVKVLYSPINPSDLGWINGVYGNQNDKKVTFPLKVGFEGVGIVENSKNLNFSKGDYISFYTTEGSWSEYTLTKEEYSIKLLHGVNNNISLMNSSMLFINPLTAYCFYSILAKSNETSCINTSGLSSLGKIFTKLCNDKGINIINLIRKNYDQQLDSHISILDGNYLTLLKDKVRELKIKTCFDCYGGEISGKILNTLEDNGILYHYGNLSMRNLGGIQTEDILFRNKQIRGFWLLDYLNQKEGKEAKHEFIQFYYKNPDYFNSKIDKVIEIDKFSEGISSYKDNMSKGKVLFKF